MKYLAVFLTTLILGIGFAIVSSRINSVNPDVEVGSYFQEEPAGAVVPQNSSDTSLKIFEENNDWKTAEKFDVDLIQTGVGFHGDEIHAKNGEKWLALLNDEDKFVLAYGKIGVRRVHDDVIDGEGETTGKSVSFDGNGKPVFMLRGNHGLREGRVDSLFGPFQKGNVNPAFPDSPVGLGVGFEHEFKTDTKIWKMRVIKAKNEDGLPFLALTLEDGQTTQTLFSVRTEDDYIGTLEWFGDLDHDSKPDFLMSLSIHDNVNYMNLFLSSKAGRPNLVKKVAVFTTTGC